MTIINNNRNINLFIYGYLKISIFILMIKFVIAVILSGLTIKILNIRTPKKFAVITLKFEQDDYTEE